MKEFLHCLRVQIAPNHHEEERIESVLRFCLNYGV